MAKITTTVDLLLVKNATYR